MGYCLDDQVSNYHSHFKLEGTFIGYVLGEEGKLKYIRVNVSERELQIKLSKESRRKLQSTLQFGDWIEVYGEQKIDGDRLKMKADEITQVVSCPLQQKTNHLAGKILICRKSGCQKRGGKQLHQALESALSRCGLQEQVLIEQTGCLKRCSAGPNLVLMPSKTKCSKIAPDQVINLLQKHYQLDNN